MDLQIRIILSKLQKKGLALLIHYYMAADHENYKSILSSERLSE